MIPFVRGFFLSLYWWAFWCGVLEMVFKKGEPYYQHDQPSKNWAFMEKFIVPHYDDPVDYLVRWRVVQTPWFGIYLHKLGTSDPRDTLHNHPWPFVSVVLRGGYDEQIFDDYDGGYSRRHRVRFINIKRLKDWHWIETLHRTPTWTLMFVGRRQRVWQYLDREGVRTNFNLHRFNDEYNQAMERRIQRVTQEQQEREAETQG